MTHHWQLASFGVALARRQLENTMGHPIVRAQPHARPQINKDPMLQLDPAVRTDSPYTLDFERSNVSLVCHTLAREQN